MPNGTWRLRDFCRAIINNFPSSGENMVSKPAGEGAADDEETGGRPGEGEAGVHFLTTGADGRHGAPLPAHGRPTAALLPVPLLFLLPSLHEV